MAPNARRVAMDNVDKAWLEMDSATNLMIINGLMWFDGTVEFEQIRSILGARFVDRFARFRQRVVTGGDGRLYWEDDPHFDLRSHVRRVALPAPADQETLQNLVSSIINEPLDRRRPLWRFFVIEGVDGGTVLFGRLHHCIADGIALIRVLLSMTAETPEASLDLLSPAPAPARHTPATPFGPLGRLARRAVQASTLVARTAVRETLLTIDDPRHPIEAARSLGMLSAAGAAILTKLLILPADRPSPFKGELGAMKRVVWSAPLELERVKAVGKATGATINDVLVAAVAGALRDYLVQAGDDPNAGDINAMVPVNLRPDTNTAELGNQFALVYLPLPISLSDPLDRLRATKHHMDVLKNSPEPFLVYQILGVIGTLPLAIAKQATTWFSSKASAVLTNVPGPRQQLYFAGRPLRRIMFWVPQSGKIGLGISIISYNGSVMLGIMADEKLVSDPQIVMDRFERQIELLAAGVLTASKRASEPVNVST